MSRARPQSAKYKPLRNLSEENQLTESCEEPSQALTGFNKLQQRKFLAKAPFIGQFNRLLPKNIPVDKERLYSEAIQLKVNNNKLQAELTKLKTRVAVLESSKAQKAEERHGKDAAGALRSLVRELRTELERVKEQNGRLKKVTKYTSLREYEEQNEALNQQLRRLKQIIESEVFKNRKLQFTEEEVKDLEEQLDSKRLQNQQLQDEVAKLRNGIKFIEEQLKAQQSKHAEQEKKHTREAAQFRRRITERDSEIGSFKQELKRTALQKTRLAKALNETKRSNKSGFMSQPGDGWQTRQNQLRRRISELEAEVASLRSVKKRPSQQKQYSPFKQELPAVQYIDQYEKESPANNLKANQFEVYQESKGQKNKKRTKSTKEKAQSGVKEEVKNIGELLSYRLKAHRFSLAILAESVERDLPPMIYINDLSGLLESQPFSITQQEQMQALLTFFYQTTNFREELSITKEKLLKKLKQILKDLKLSSEEEEDACLGTVRDLFQSRGSEIEAQFISREVREGFISKLDFRTVLRDFGLDKECVEVALSEVALYSDSMQELYYGLLFERYSSEEFREVQEVSEEYEQSKSNTMQGPPQELAQSRQDRRRRGGSGVKASSSRNQEALSFQEFS